MEVASVSKTTWTSADGDSEQDLQGPSATSEEAQTDCIASGATINIENYRVIIKILHPCRKVPTSAIYEPIV
jgi:hypothetical protein